MVYGSVCSGVEAASVAWEPLGWQPAWFAEIEPFPCDVLAHRFPSVPNLGDMTKLGEHDEYNSSAIDLLVGGTPCQSFSQAGKRLGLDDPRGNLALHFLRIAREKGLAGSSGRMSLASSQATTDGTSAPSSRRWSTAGMASATESWTLAISESPRTAIGSSLSGILETGVPPQQYFLSAKHLITTLRETAMRRGVYLYVRSATREMRTPEVLSWLSLLAERGIATSEDLNLKKGRTSISED